ncbi:MAG: hypothetical protein ACRYGF_04210 [Janthinobacterium lividum]
MDTFEVGDTIRLTFADAPGEPLLATICSILSDADEGLSPEIEDYVACWLEVSFEGCDDPNGRRSIALGTDFQYTLDGQKLTLTKCAS